MIRVRSVILTFFYLSIDKFRYPSDSVLSKDKPILLIMFAKNKAAIKIDASHEKTNLWKLPLWGSLLSVKDILQTTDNKWSKKIAKAIFRLRLSIIFKEKNHIVSINLWKIDDRCSFEERNLIMRATQTDTTYAATSDISISEHSFIFGYPPSILLPSKRKSQNLATHWAIPITLTIWESAYQKHKNHFHLGVSPKSLAIRELLIKSEWKTNLSRLSAVTHIKCSFAQTEKLPLWLKGQNK